MIIEEKSGMKTSIKAKHKKSDVSGKKSTFYRRVERIRIAFYNIVVVLNIRERFFQMFLKF